MMRFRLGLGLSVIIMLLGLVGAVRVVNAYSIHAGSNVALTQGQKINDTVYSAGRTVDINTEVYGDVFCVGQNVTINGTVHGDVICAGQNVTVNGRVEGDVRLAGQSVTLNATVTGNATVGSQNFILDSGGSVGNDLTIGSSDIVLNGKIGRDIVMSGQNVTLNSQVGRDIKVQADKFNKTSVAQVGGTISRTTPQKHQQGRHHGFGLAWFLYCFVALLLMTMVLALLFPRPLHAVTNQAFPRPWKALLTGFVACLVAPMVVFLLGISVIGIPLAILAGLIWAVVLLLSGPLFAYYLGRLILRRSNHALLFMLVGAVVLIVLYFIPILNVLAILAALWFGSGMLLLELRRRLPRPRYRLA